MGRAKVYALCTQMKDGHHQYLKYKHYTGANSVSSHYAMLAAF